MPITVQLRRALLSRFAQASAVTMRDITAAGRAAYLAVVIVGILEPVLYLLSIGMGVGALVGPIPMADGTTVPYREFVAPAMLASSAMNAAVFETSIEFFAKLKYRKTYDAMIYTPTTPTGIAFGQLMWALLCGMTYSVAFLVVMVCMQLASPLRALAAFPVVLLVSATFGAIGLLSATFMRGWQDFDYSFGIIFAMFLFSGTFMPIDTSPPLATAVAAITPLYHGVSALRSITTGSIGLGLVPNLLYLALMVVGCMFLASRRVTRIVYR
jgi:lipooligosaccharide transport system permease protein